MNKILATLAITAISAAAFAGVTFDGRFDYASNTYNTTTTTNTTGYSGFMWNYAKMGFTGKASDSVTAKAKLNFLASSNLHANGKDMTGTGLTSAGSLYPSTSFYSDLVESAEVSTKVSDSVTATFGKLSTPGTSGFEGAESTISQYFMSAGYFYPRLTGASFNYELNAGQSLSLAVFNGTNTFTTDNSRAGMSLGYSGNYGNLSVLASYLVDPQGISGTKDVNNTYMTVGFQYKADANLFKFDYDLNTITNSAFGSGNDKKITAMVFSYENDMGKWIPGIKFESTTKSAYQTAGTTDSDITITNFALYGDYKANTADNFGYHFAAVSTASKYGSKAAYGATNDNVTATLAYAGITYTGDFMK